MRGHIMWPRLYCIADIQHMSNSSKELGTFHGFFSLDKCCFNHWIYGSLNGSDVVDN
jgi:hypothetical protein